MYIYVYIILLGSPFVTKNWHSGNIKPTYEKQISFLNPLC